MNASINIHQYLKYYIFSTTGCDIINMITSSIQCSLGGTVDITVHEVMAKGNLKELLKASGGAWGGTQIDQAYWGFLCNLLGK